MRDIATQVNDVAEMREEFVYTSVVFLLVARCMILLEMCRDRRRSEVTPWIASGAMDWG